MKHEEEPGETKRYLDTTNPEDYCPDFGNISPSQISLTELADAHGSDKGTLKHNYCKIYETIINNLLTPTQNDKNSHRLSILEIGVACGASLRTWAHYLPASLIVGIDIRDKCKNLCSDVDNISIIICDARNKNNLDKKLVDSTFDLIVDDGSHVSEDMVATVQSLWERVNPGGYYVIEDMSCTYKPNYTTHIKETYGETVINSRSTILSLLDTLMRSCDIHKDHAIKHKVEEIMYYPQLLVIRKSS